MQKKCIWSSVDVDVCLSLHGELDVEVHAVQVLQKILQPFRIMGLYHEVNINIAEPAISLVRSSTEGLLLEVLCE